MSTEVSFRAFHEAAARRWHEERPAKCVRPNAVSGVPISKIRVLTPYDENSGDPVRTDIDVVPWILVRDMPCSEYPKYLGFFLHASYAWLKITRPELHKEMSNGSSCNTIVPIVGVKAGMIESLGPPCNSAPSAIGSFLLYDAKRARLWIKPQADNPTYVLWQSAMATIPEVPGHTMTCMMAWCRMAPLLACMASSQEFSAGPSYSVPFVQRAISSYFQAVMDGRAYATMVLASPLTWDSAMYASISGYPSQACRAWAVDPLMALCAEKRAIVDQKAMDNSREREAEICRKFKRSSNTSVAMDDAGATRWDHLRAAVDYVAATDDDNMSMATALLQDAPEYGVGPDDSVSAAHTQVPSRARTPPPAVTQAQMENIREAARRAQAMPNAAASMMRGVTGEESVVW